MNFSETAIRDTFSSKLSELVEFAIKNNMHPTEIIGWLETAKLSTFWEMAKVSEAEVSDFFKGDDLEQ